MKIQSFSDIITNSSSEIFIIKNQSQEKCQEIMEMLEGVYEALKRNINEDMYMEIANFHEEDSDYGFTINPGDLVIESGGDNSIPCAVMELIDHLWSLDDSIQYSDIVRRHLG